MLAPLLAMCLALPFVAFAGIARLRRSRQRALAAALGAEHVDQGPFAPGVIRGEDFHIEVVRAGKACRTRVRVAARSTPGIYWLKPGFFSGDPDWTQTRVPAVVVQRAFFWRVGVPGTAFPDEGQRDALLRWIRPPALSTVYAASLAAARIHEIDVADGGVSVSFAGVVQDRERIERTLVALRELPAERAGSGRRRTA